MHGADTDLLMSEDIGLPFALMRGGTSKAVFLLGSDLPPDHQTRDRVILALFGSPDPRQIDGLGGADLLTSKLAIIDPPSHPDSDLDYTFGQVSITEPVVDYDINCGNISAAVAAYAVDNRLVEPQEPATTVRIYNTNTRTVLVAEVPVVAGRAAIAGDSAIDGVPGTGAAIALDFRRTAGGTTGALLPTGSELNVLDTELGPVEATIVDLANLCVFFEAPVVGMSGIEGPREVTDLQSAAVASVKAAAAKVLDLPTDGLIPVPVVVSPPVGFTSFATGKEIPGASVDLTVRVIGGRPPVLHKTFPGTVAACTGVAAALPGSVVFRNARRAAATSLHLGHPSGIMSVDAAVERNGKGWDVSRAAYMRTARRLAEGTAFVRSALWA